MHRISLIIALTILLTLISSPSPVLARDTAGAEPGATASPAGTAFTYQGQLIYNGAPVNDTCSFTFSLWDEGGSSPLNGKQIGSDVVLPSVAVVDGLFSVSLDFGAGAFGGEARWLQIWVDCSNISDFLWPRQPLTPAPYSIRSESAADADTLDGEYASAFADTSHAHSPIDIVPQGGNSGLDADFLDGQEASAFAGASHNHDNAYWSLTGNAGTTPGTDFLGTTDGQALELHVNGSRALRLEPDATSPNVVAGHSNNAVLDDAYGSVIGGGGNAGTFNRVYDNYGAIGGGMDNQVGSNDGDPSTADYAVVGGGYSNEATGVYATVGGGTNNEATVQWATVGGGAVNTASGNAAIVSGGIYNSATRSYSTVGGGSYNQAQATYSVIAGGGPSDTGNPTTTNNVVYDNYGAIGGGGDNRAGTDDSNSKTAEYATVSGGQGNEASAAHATVGGGEDNEASAAHATICGGWGNDATGSYVSIGGGYDNDAAGSYASIGGGIGNNASADATIGGGSWNLASGNDSTISGGYNHDATGEYTVVPGGYNNEAAGDFSFAAGRRAKANNAGCFIWGDSTNADVPCNTDDRTVFRSSGGFQIYTSGDLSTGIDISPGGSSWNTVSDRAKKDNFEPVDGAALLENLAAIEISTWNYKAQDPAIRHIGPMAQDFNALLPELGGEGEKYINTLDADGVALASIQGLYQLAQKQSSQIETLQQRIADLEALVMASEHTPGTDADTGAGQ